MQSDGATGETPAGSAENTNGRFSCHGQPREVLRLPNKAKGSLPVVRESGGGLSIGAKIRRKARIGVAGLRAGIARAQVLQQPLDAPRHIDFFEELLLEQNGKRQGKAEQVRERSQRKLALQELAKLLLAG